MTPRHFAVYHDGKGNTYTSAWFDGDKEQFTDFEGVAWTLIRKTEGQYTGYHGNAAAECKAIITAWRQEAQS